MWFQLLYRVLKGRAVLKGRGCSWGTPTGFRLGRLGNLREDSGNHHPGTRNRILLLLVGKHGLFFCFPKDPISPSKAWRHFEDLYTPAVQVHSPETIGGSNRWSLGLEDFNYTRCFCPTGFPKKNKATVGGNNGKMMIQERYLWLFLSTDPCFVGSPSRLFFEWVVFP